MAALNGFNVGYNAVIINDDNLHSVVTLPKRIHLTISHAFYFTRPTSVMCDVSASSRLSQRLVISISQAIIIFCIISIHSRTIICNFCDTLDGYRHLNNSICCHITDTTSIDSLYSDFITSLNRLVLSSNKLYTAGSAEYIIYTDNAFTSHNIYKSYRVRSFFALQAFALVHEAFQVSPGKIIYILQIVNHEHLVPHTLDSERCSFQDVPCREALGFLICVRHLS